MLLVAAAEGNKEKIKKLLVTNRADPNYQNVVSVYIAVIYIFVRCTVDNSALLLGINRTTAVR